MKRALALCIAAASILPAMAEEEKSDGCLFSRQVDGFEDTSRDSIVLTAGRQRWLAEFGVSCIGIEDALAVGVKAFGTCVASGDTVEFKDNAGMQQHCMISKLTKIEKP